MGVVIMQVTNADTGNAAARRYSKKRVIKRKYVFNAENNDLKKYRKVKCNALAENWNSSIDILQSVPTGK
jgi:hypothetical protein